MNISKFFNFKILPKIKYLAEVYKSLRIFSNFPKYVFAKFGEDWMQFDAPGTLRKKCR